MWREGDKVLAYRNWLGLMRGDLAETFEKNGAGLTRHPNPNPNPNKAFDRT